MKRLATTDPHHVQIVSGEVDVEEDSPELEAELLKAADGPFRPYAPENLDEIARRVLERSGKQ